MPRPFTRPIGHHLQQHFEQALFLAVIVPKPRLRSTALAGLRPWTGRRLRNI